MPRRKNKHKDISRIDQDTRKTHGWYVRVRFLGKSHDKYFSDRLHGGKDATLDKALSWRNATEMEIGKVRTDNIMVTVGNTATGVVGVRFNEKMNKYEATWVDKEGKPGKTSVAVRKHGKAKAFKMACDIRRKKDAERLGS